MKLMRLAMCVAAFAVVGGMAVAEDMDVKALQAKLAAQEARLNDLQAKMYGASCEGDIADGLTSLRKNATVTLGGTVNTRYFYRTGTIKTDAYTPGNVQKTDKSSYGDLRVSDAKLEVKIDVNDNFDAYVKMDLNDGRNENASVAQNYWIRWKNISNSGFGVLVGRDTLKWGQSPTVGVLDSWTGVQGGTLGDAFSGFVMPYAGTGEGMFAGGGPLPTHSAWDYSRTTQINPYWENCDGSFKAEVSFIQAIDTRNGLQSQSVAGQGFPYDKYKSINYGLGSMTGRITWKPIEGLKLTASIMNLYAKHEDGAWSWPHGRPGSWNATPDFRAAKNNTATQIGFEYTPCFLSRMTVWGTWQHGWNEGWVDDMDSDVINAGVKFNVTDQAYIFAQGDYMRVKNDQGQTWHKSKGYAGYLGFGYTLPYGVSFETGYRHDKVDFKDRGGRKHTKYSADTVYAHLGFNF